eukprot:1159462-Pelagomonas_calceolata.AAC.3
MEPQQAGDKPEEVETKAGDISPQQQDEGTSTAAAPANSEDAGYIGSYTADASAGEGSHEQVREECGHGKDRELLRA